MTARNSARWGRALPLVALTLLACGRGGGGSPKPAPPAKVDNPVKETALATVTLTPRAEERLGVAIGAVEKRRVARQRTFGGEVVVPRGRSILVSAPVAGTVVGAAAPAAGKKVSRGQVVLRLLPLPATGELAGASVRVEAARKKAERAERLLAAGAGSQRALEEARAELEIAETSEGAVAPRAGAAGRRATTAGAMAIEAPQEGVLREILVGAGQAVASGAPLFQVDAVGAVWVRVPVYVGELGSVARDRPALVRAVGATAGDAGRAAQPVAAPPSADPVAATGDLFYALPNDDGAFRPGQKVDVGLPLAGEDEERLVVPWSAVVHDIHGGTWVYEAATPHVFTRRRVEIRQVVGPWAVLGRGPALGTRVVTVAAAELYGTEFGPGK